jgi:hypothetical protein
MTITQERVESARKDERTGCYQPYNRRGAEPSTDPQLVRSGRFFTHLEDILA